MSRHLELAIGSRTIEANGVELFPSAAVAEWRGLMLLAQQQLGSVSTGLGFFGSPEWVVGGGFALGFLESALSTVKAKEGVKTLERASVALRTIKTARKFFPIADIQQISEPLPTTWAASGIGKRKVEIGKIGMLDRGRFLRDHNRTKSDVIDGFVEIEDVIPFSILGEDFLRFRTNDGDAINIRWTSVDALKLV